MVFYISSRGHSATTWLAQALMGSGGVVCFHGTRSLAGFDSGTVPDLSVDCYMAGLAQMERNTGLVFGSVHGYYGDAALPATRSHGGVFLAILRDPVKRIQSIYAANISAVRRIADELDVDPFAVSPSSHMSSELQESVAISLHALEQRWARDTARPNLARRTSRAGVRILDRSRLTLAAKRASSGPKLDDLGTAIATLFFGAVRDTFALDGQSIAGCDAADLVLMERFTTDFEYFRDSIWKRVILDSTHPVPRPELRPRLNDHVSGDKREVQTEILFAEWGSLFQEHFLHMALKYPQSRDKYRDVGYFCP